MSKKFKFKNGHEGVVSDAVAKILTEKKQGSVIGEEKPAESKRASLVKAAIKKGVVKDESELDGKDENAIIEMMKGAR